MKIVALCWQLEVYLLSKSLVGTAPSKFEFNMSQMRRQAACRLLVSLTKPKCELRLSAHILVVLEMYICECICAVADIVLRRLLGRVALSRRSFLGD